MLIAGIDTLKHYLPNTCQISEETTKKIVRIYSGAMTHRAKILAVSGTLGLGVAYKIGILTAMPALTGLAVIPIFYKIHQSYLAKNTAPQNAAPQNAAPQNTRATGPRNEVDQQNVVETKEAIKPQDAIAQQGRLIINGTEIFHRKNLKTQFRNGLALVWIEKNKEHINKPLRGQFTALHFAITYDFNISVINSLITAGANLNSGPEGFSPLDCAINKYKDSLKPDSALDSEKHLEIIKILLLAKERNNESINIPPFGDFRPIHFAIIKDLDVSIIESLIKAEADVDAISENDSPLDLAISKYKNSLQSNNHLKVEKCLEIIRDLIFMGQARQCSDENYYYLRAQDISEFHSFCGKPGMA